MEHTRFTQISEELLLSSEFQELSAKLEFHEPNLWHILRISRKEILMSRFLAWLLDPRTNHSFKDQFLKKLVVQTLQTEGGRGSRLTPVDVLVMDLSNVEVETEHRVGNRLYDIVVFSPDEDTDRDKRFLCIIENKIDAKEGYEQTNDYYQTSLVAFPAEEYPHRVYIYLSPDGDLPKNEEFIPLSYQAILQVIRELLKNSQPITETERYLLQQFQENISRGIAMDTKTLDLAQAIYEQYRDVFEFIFQNVDRETEDEQALPKKWDGKSRFFNIGEKAGSGYRWDDCRKYNFICAGGAKRYRNLMQELKIGDIIYAYVSGKGYVGIGTVMQKAVPFREAKLPDGQHLLDLVVGEYNYSEDNDECDWIAFVTWKYKVEKDRAVRQEHISRLTTSRIYDHRKDIIEQVESELAQKNT